jgi:hypothetical protein
MNNFVKGMGQTGPAFRNLAEKLPGINAAQVKDGVFIGQQIRKLFRDKQLDRILSCNEKMEWNDVWLLATIFMGNKKTDNYNKLVEDLLSYQKLGSNMSLKSFFCIITRIFFRKTVGH